jgi:hypothetical protein
MPVLQHAVKLDAIALYSASGARKGMTRVCALVRQPAFAQLEPDQLATLLEVVVEANDSNNFLLLTQRGCAKMPTEDDEWPAFKQLDAATVSSLMMLAVKAAGRGQSTGSEHHILRALWTSEVGWQLREDGCQPALPVLLAAFSVWPVVTADVRSVFMSMFISAGGTGSTVQLEVLTAALQTGDKQVFGYLWQAAGASLTRVDLGQLLCIASRSRKRMFNAVKRLLCAHHAWDANPASSAVTKDK